MDKNILTDKLLDFRTKTYAAGTGKVEPALNGSIQYEYTDGDWLYRDVYFIGNGIFPGLETVYYQEKPVWSMSYFGNFSKMSEDQADTMLRPALMDLWQETRIFNNIEKDFGTFKYKCNGQGTIDELSGTEEIFIGNDRVYFLYYAGGFIG